MGCGASGEREGWEALGFTSGLFHVVYAILHYQVDIS